MAEDTTAGDSMDPNADPNPDPTPDPAPDPARTFSQADVDRIVKERVARVKAAPPADYDDLKAAAARLAEIEEANKSELERAIARAEAAEKDREKILADAKETRLTAAILAEAAKADRKVIDPEAAVQLLDKSTLELDDNGVPTNIADAMDSLLKTRPFLVAQTGGARGDADQGARTVAGIKQVTEAELKTMSHKEINEARRDGRLKALLGADS